VVCRAGPGAWLAARLWRCHGGRRIAAGVAHLHGALPWLHQPAALTVAVAVVRGCADVLPAYLLWCVWLVWCAVSCACVSLVV
jgi:hypothetical protein